MTGYYYTWSFVPIPIGLLLLTAIVIYIIERRRK